MVLILRYSPVDVVNQYVLENAFALLLRPVGELVHKTVNRPKNGSRAL